MCRYNKINITNTYIHCILQVIQHEKLAKQADSGIQRANLQGANLIGCQDTTHRKHEIVDLFYCTFIYL